MALLWLSLRVRWRRAWARSLTVALLIGGVGGFVVAAAASARRVGGTYQTLIDEIGAPDLVVVPGCERPTVGFGCVAPPEQASGAVLVDRLERLGVVEHARYVSPVPPYFVDADGGPLLATVDDEFGCFDDDRSVSLLALEPGGATQQAMPFRLHGELPATGSSGVVLAMATAKRVGLGVGDKVRLAGWCTGDGDPVELAQPIDLTVTGVSVGPLDIEPPGTGLAIEPAYVDPVIVDQLVTAGAELQLNEVVWLDRVASADAVNQALADYEISIDLRERAVVFDDALATDARLLWLLAVVGGTGGVLLLAPIVGRNLRETARDSATLVSLGSSRGQIACQALAHVGVLALIGACAAALVAPPISAFMPRGFAVAIAPDRAVWVDGQVTIIGFALVVCAVLAMAAVPAWRSGRAGRIGGPRASTHRSILVGSLRLRSSAQSGVLTAVGTPAGPRQASPWPSFLSLVIAGATCVASLTYLAGLDHVERTPSLVGWNWDATVGFEQDAVDRLPSILAELDRIDGVELVTAGTLYPPTFLDVPGTEIVVFPWSFATGSRAIRPTMLTGRAPDGSDEVAINNVFADASGLVVGDSVTFARPALVSAFAQEFEQWALASGVAELAFDAPDDPAIVATFEITGLAVLPLQRTQEFAQASFTLSGLATFVEPSDDEVASVLEALPDDLPADLQAETDQFLSNLEIENRGVYLRSSGDLQATAAAIAEIDGIEQVVAPSAEQVLNIGIGLNLGNNHRVPDALVIVVASAAAALLTYLLITTVRARRFEFAIMRALGLSGSGIRWSIAAQATATALIPFVVAIPVGVAVGRQAWLNYATDLEVVPESVTPWSSLALVVTGAIVIANLVALVPGWAVTRRPPDADLRAG